ncbi:Murein DD-endopeptidase MepM [Fundidesulfovibrio magnetotacticus]|uniref:Murein DD-endopeptidase MepM n=1 Tax=Fundidesulfovibrio magnetotacticus TaxID=2730080 RepID=A0A6V8LT66_9BACT|nr:M23 family metallopeptidase [Fundidesulfovibrio magnetotacticus]GFK94150.1 Murein DD-endopeptidase MepM [Fundidesulfovibrio magnetotacticus]
MRRSTAWVLYVRRRDGSLRRGLRLPAWVLGVVLLAAVAGTGHLVWRLPDLAGLAGLDVLERGEEGSRQAWREALIAQHGRLAALSRALDASAGFNAGLASVVKLPPTRGPERSIGSAGQVEGGFADEVRLSRQLAATSRALLEEVAFQEARQRLLASILRERATELAGRPSLWPVRGALNSDFGYRFMGRARDFHNGVDIGVPVGTPVSAPADGTVSFVGYESGYGLMVVIEHRSGVSTAYAHLRSAEVAPGEEIRRGARIAHSGMSGRTTGSHLHYEVRVNGQPVDPMPFMVN